MIWILTDWRNNQDLFFKNYCVWFSVLKLERKRRKNPRAKRQRSQKNPGNLQRKKRRSRKGREASRSGLSWKPKEWNSWWHNCLCFARINSMSSHVPLTNAVNWLKHVTLSFVELPLQKLLQPAFLGSVPCICAELHSAVLQGKNIFLHMNDYVVLYICYKDWVWAASGLHCSLLSRCLKSHPMVRKWKDLDWGRAAGCSRALACLKVQGKKMRDLDLMKEETRMRKTCRFISIWRRARATCSPPWPSSPSCTQSSRSSASSATTASR